MQAKIVIAGIGGRGVLFTTRVLAEAAREKGLPVLVSETHGMSQRRGSVLSQIKIGAEESPLIRPGTADIMLALEKEEGLKNLAYVKEGGMVIVNTDQLQMGSRDIAHLLEEKRIKVFFVDADRTAANTGYFMAANMVLLGFLEARAKQELTELDLRATLERLSPEEYLQVNLTAFDAGEHLGQDSSPYQE
ncbi:MAG: 2-oxoacid:acceptor oxidoreductase family protein [Thermodesulfobacteriota bacterium]